MLVSCAFCGEQMERLLLGRHESVCVFSETVLARMKAVVESRERPGFIVSMEEYSVLARHEGLPSRAVVRRRFGNWQGVAAFFGLDYERYAPHHLAPAAVAALREQEFEDAEIAECMGMRVRAPRPALEGLAAKVVRSYDPYLHKWVSDVAVGLR
jgi:hypothetical protein